MTPSAAAGCRVGGSSSETPSGDEGRKRRRSSRQGGVFQCGVVGKGSTMELVDLGDVALTYTSLDSLDFGSDGQLYGTLDGRLVGDRVSGELRLTNLAPRRADNVNLPTLRGVLTTDDQAIVWVELDGVATLRASDHARVFVTTFRFRTGDERYAWLNSVFGVLEGVLDAVGVGGRAHGRLFECRATVT